MFKVFVTFSWFVCSVQLSQVVDFTEFLGRFWKISIVANSTFSADFLFIFCANINLVFLSTSVWIAEKVERTDKIESPSKCQNSCLFSNFGKYFFLSKILVGFWILEIFWVFLQLYFLRLLCFLVKKFFKFYFSHSLE